MTFELIEAEKGNYPKALMCRALGLSRSGHHAFSTRGPSRRELDDQRLDVLVAAIFAELGGRYGAPRIEQELRRRGVRTSRKRVAASMVRQDLRARPRRRWRRTTDSSHREPIAPNLLGRNFTAKAPDRAWVADTTYLPVLGGFLFLVVILDLFSRKVVGWSLGDRLVAELSGEALRRAIARRQPGPLVPPLCGASGSCVWNPTGDKTDGPWAGAPARGCAAHRQPPPRWSTPGSQTTLCAAP